MVSVSRPHHQGAKTYRVSKKCWTPAGKDTSQALGAAYLAPGLEVSFIQLRVNLASAFDQIEGCDCCMGGTLPRPLVSHYGLLC